MPPVDTAIAERLIEVSVTLKVHAYRLERPPPLCHNPDSPNFSDPGCGPEIEFSIQAEDANGNKLPRWLMDAIENAAENDPRVEEWALSFAAKELGEER